MVFSLKFVPFFKLERSFYKCFCISFLVLPGIEGWLASSSVQYGLVSHGGHGIEVLCRTQSII